VTPREVAMCVGFSVAMPIGQSLFKWAAIYNTRLSGPLPLRLVSNLPLMGAFAWYGLTALFWFYILTRVPLSSAYGYAILGSGLVPVIAALVFKEPVTWQMAAGYALMLAGLLLTTLGRA
jgi:drug/metabolite transporter (DMT)-like permease